MATRSFTRILAALAGTVAILALSLAAGVVGAYHYTLASLPEAATIRDIPLQIPLRVYSRDGKLIAEIGEQRRIPVEYEEIPGHVVQAFLAAEDDRFFEHPGIDYQGVLRAGINFLATGSRSQGGSTITQQLARDYFLTRERLFTRKIREAFLAWKIEKEFSKEEILAMFLNKMFFGQRAYGVAAASRVYFNKTLEEINAAEAATLAGLLQAPSAYNPVRSPEKATTRRSYVLRRMRELDYLTEAEYDAAMEYPMESRLYGPAVELTAPYLAEMVRREMLERYGPEIYSGGYRVTTTLDSSLQTAAVYAVRNGLLEYDRRHGYRGPLARLELPVPAGGDEGTNGRGDGRDNDNGGNGGGDSYSDSGYPALPADVLQTLEDYPEPGGLRVGVVVGLGEDNSAAVALRRDRIVRVPWSGISWAKRYIDDDRVGSPPESVGEVLAVGDVIHVMPTVSDRWALAQVPAPQGALVSVDPDDGAVVSLVGGFDYAASKFNRAVQIRRQPGSAFKPFIYSAALENGFTAATIVNDTPVVFESEELEGPWKPINYTGKFYGPVRLREALYRSLNLASVRVLIGTGLGDAVPHIRSFGFAAEAVPYNYSLALGSGAVSPLDMALGYAVFANGGYRVEPYFIDRIEDSEGNVLDRADPALVCPECEYSEELAEIDTDPFADPLAGRDDGRTDPLAGSERLEGRTLDWRPTANEDPRLYAGMRLADRVLTKENAFLVADMMRDVIRRGTGRRARSLGRDDLYGKTGTSNDRRDAWFGGFNADLVAVTWVGFDEDKPLGAGEEGSRTALPVWIHFMERALDGAPTARVEEPEGLVTVRVSPETGRPVSSADGNFIFEKFRVGNEPEAGTIGGADEIYNDTGSSGDIEDPIF
ncbi:penicillin-binding protein 1A [Lentisalinibacter orientalis]|uniref:penicillin-binding protein 1A n=1 Tax=Lentisalinibacter orientalis TaxID=2992241 RepID=UPI00386C9A43